MADDKSNKAKKILEDYIYKDVEREKLNPNARQEIKNAQAVKEATEAKILASQNKQIAKNINPGLSDLHAKAAEKARELLDSGKKEEAISFINKAKQLLAKRGIEAAEDLKKAGKFEEALAMGAKRGLKTGLKSSLKMLPLIGGIASAFYEKDASAAIPILNEADSLGPAPGSYGAQMEDPRISEQERIRLTENQQNPEITDTERALLAAKLKEKYKNNMLKKQGE